MRELAMVLPEDAGPERTSTCGVSFSLVSVQAVYAGCVHIHCPVPARELRWISEHVCVVLVSRRTLECTLRVSRILTSVLISLASALRDCTSLCLLHHLVCLFAHLAKKDDVLYYSEMISCFNRHGQRNGTFDITLLLQSLPELGHLVGQARVVIKD